MQDCELTSTLSDRFICAIEKRWIEVVELFLLHGVRSIPINLHDMNNTCNKKEDTLKLIQLVIDYKPEGLLDNKDWKGNTALMKAVENNYVKVIEALIEGKANINLQNDSGETALMLATKRNFFNSEIFEVLLAGEPDLNVQDNLGNTPLMRAAENERFRAVEALIAKGADINLKNSNGSTVLWNSIVSTDPDSNKVVQILLKSGAEIISEKLYSMLVSSVNYGAQKVKLLLESGALDLELDHGFWALWNAIEEKNVEVVKALLAGGVTLDRFTKSDRSLLVKRINSEEIMNAFLEVGAFDAKPDSKLS